MKFSQMIRHENQSILFKIKKMALKSTRVSLVFINNKGFFLQRLGLLNGSSYFTAREYIKFI